MDCWGSGPTLEQKFACFERFKMDLGSLVVVLWPCANSHLRAGGDTRSVRNFYICVCVFAYLLSVFVYMFVCFFILN